MSEWIYEDKQLKFDNIVLLQTVENELFLRSWKTKDNLNKIYQALFLYGKSEEDKYLRIFIDKLVKTVNHRQFVDKYFKDCFLDSVPEIVLCFWIDLYLEVIREYDHFKEYQEKYLVLLKSKAYLLLKHLSDEIDYYPTEENEEGREFSRMLVQSIIDWKRAIETPENRFYFGHRGKNNFLNEAHKEMTYLLKGVDVKENWNKISHNGLKHINKNLYSVHIKKNRTQTSYMITLDKIEAEILSKYYTKHYFISESLRYFDSTYKISVLLSTILCLFITTILCIKNFITLWSSVFIFPALAYLSCHIVGFLCYRTKYTPFLYIRTVGILLVGLLPLIITDELWKFLLQTTSKNLVVFLIVAILVLVAYTWLEVSNRQREIVNYPNRWKLSIDYILFLSIMFIQSLVISFFINIITFEKLGMEHLGSSLKDTLEWSFATIEYSPSLVFVHAILSMIIGVIVQGLWDDKSMIEPV